MPAPFKDYPADYFQNQLFPSNVFDLLPDDHDCFVYRDLFEQLDTSELAPGEPGACAVEVSRQRNFQRDRKGRASWSEL